MIDMLELEQDAYRQGGSWLLEELLEVKRTHTSAYKCQPVCRGCNTITYHGISGET